MGVVVIGVLAVLSVPIMLIVALVKLSWIEGQLSSLDKKIETADIAKKINQKNQGGAQADCDDQRQCGGT